MLKRENFIILTVVTLAYADIFVIQQRPKHEVISEIRDMPARFGNSIPFEGFKGRIVVANPVNACIPIDPPPVEPEPEYYEWNIFVLVQRFDCSFELKIRNAQNAGFDGVIVYNVNSSDLEIMSAKDPEGILIPSVFIGDEDALLLKDCANADFNDTSYYVVITSDIPFNISTHLLVPFAIIVGLCFLVMLIFMIIKCIKDRRRQRRYRLPKSSLNKIPTCKFVKGAPYDTCVICLDDFVEGDKLRVLPCAHAYHYKCIDPWLTKNRRVCPICKRKVFAHDERPEPDSESDSEVDDTLPLINPTNSQANSRNGGTFVVQRENPFQRARRTFLERQQQGGGTTQSAVVAPSSETDYSIQSDDTSDNRGGVGGGDTTSQSSSLDDNSNSLSSFRNFFRRVKERHFTRSNHHVIAASDNENDQFATSSDYHSINAENVSDIEESQQPQINEQQQSDSTTPHVIVLNGEQNNIDRVNQAYNV